MVAATKGTENYRKRQLSAIDACKGSILFRFSEIFNH